MTFPPLIIWAKALFFFEQLFPVLARTRIELRSGPFFWAQNLGFWPKNLIFAIALGVTVHFPLGIDFLTFRSGVTAVSVEKFG